jgi:hypothetical protein
MVWLYRSPISQGEEGVKFLVQNIITCPSLLVGVGGMVGTLWFGPSIPRHSGAAANEKIKKITEKFESLKTVRTEKKENILPRRRFVI